MNGTRNTAPPGQAAPRDGSAVTAWLGWIALVAAVVLMVLQLGCGAGGVR